MPTGPYSLPAIFYYLQIPHRNGIHVFTQHARLRTHTNDGSRPAFFVGYPVKYRERARRVGGHVRRLLYLYRIQNPVFLDYEIYFALDVYLFTVPFDLFFVLSSVVRDKITVIETAI